MTGKMDRHFRPLPRIAPPADTWRLVGDDDLRRAASERYGVPLLCVTPDMARAEYARLLALAGYAELPAPREETHRRILAFNAAPDVCPLAVDEAARLLGLDAAAVTAADVARYYAYTDSVEREGMADD